MKPELQGLGGAERKGRSPIDRQLQSYFSGIDKFGPGHPDPIHFLEYAVRVSEANKEYTQSTLPEQSDLYQSRAISWGTSFIRSLLKRTAWNNMRQGQTY
jgi:hypothetical protein